MINEIICIGTSFTEGHGLNPRKCLSDTISVDPAVIWYKENKGIEIKSMGEYAWPSILKKLSGIKTRNLGKCGSSIEYLMRNVEHILEREDVSDKFFILEYSNWGRSELWSPTRNEWLVANWGPRDGYDPTTEGYAVMITTDYNFGYQSEPSELTIYEKYLDTFFNEKEYLIQRDKYFLNLLYKLKAKNIKYSILGLEPPFWEELLVDDLFHSNVLNKTNLWKDVMDLKITLGDLSPEIGTDGHPSIEGHEYIANLIYTALKERGEI